MNIGIDASSRTCLPYYFYFVWFSAWKNVQTSMWNNVETIWHDSQQKCLILSSNLFFPVDFLCLFALNWFIYWFADLYYTDLFIHCTDFFSLLQFLSSCPTCFSLIPFLFSLICRFRLYWFIYSLHWFLFHCFSFWVLVLLASLLFHFCFHQLFSWPCVSFFLPHQHLIGFVCFSFSKTFFKFRWIVYSIFIMLRFLRYYDFDEFHKMCSNLWWCLFVIVHQLITISSD